MTTDLGTPKQMLATMIYTLICVYLLAWHHLITNGSIWNFVLGIMLFIYFPVMTLLYNVSKGDE